MKKFLLVTFIVMVLVIDLYGIVDNIMKNFEKETEVNHIYETVTVVYEE